MSGSPCSANPSVDPTTVRYESLEDESGYLIGARILEMSDADKVSFEKYVTRINADWLGHGLARIGFDRKRDFEGRAVTHLARYGDRAACFFNSGFHDVEADATAGDLRNLGGG